MKLKNLAAAISAVAMVGALSSAQAALIGFNADPTNPDLESVDSFDWAPGNALAVDAIKSNTFDVGDVFTTYWQAELTKAGMYNIPVGSNGSFEYTAVATINEKIVFSADTDGDGIDDLTKFQHVGGTFRMYYDDFSSGINADGRGDDGTAGTASGLGYDDGTLILEATIVSDPTGVSQFVITDASGTAGLDLHAGDDVDGGVTTVQGIGSTNLVATVVWFDPAFFDFGPKGLDSWIQMVWESSLRNPFIGVNPEASVGGNTPDYGNNNINGVWSGGEAEDFHFQADANSNFVVPEPGTLLLMSLGLFGLSGLARKRQRVHSI